MAYRDDVMASGFSLDRGWSGADGKPWAAGTFEVRKVRVYGFGWPWNADLCPKCLRDAEDEKHARDERNNELLMSCPPSDWSPDDAGEAWGEDDY
jgi:hypothetical protein